MDRLQSMRVFQHVAHEGGFAAAARKLDLDPAAITRHVADLEDHLGARLLHRTTRRIALTPAGEEYLARIKPILADIDDAESSVKGEECKLEGVVRVLAPAVIATHLIAPAMRGFHERYPEIRVDVRALDTPDIPLEEFDLTFTGLPETLPTDVVVREVSRSHAILCASPAYLKKHAIPRQPQDLEIHRLLRLRGAATSRGVLKLLHPQTGREHEVPVSAAFVADHQDTLLRATLDGAGISSMPEDLVAGYINDGQLVPVLRPWITHHLTLVAAYANRRFLNARARALLDHMIEHVQTIIDQSRCVGCAAEDQPKPEAEPVRLRAVGGRR
jgi:DNA-binding transcriptional LysR family regulator